MDLNENPQSGSAASPSIEDVIARGAASALEAEPGTAPESGSDLEITEPRKRRPYKRRAKKDAEPTPEELAQQEAAAELEAFFSPEGIGAVFVAGLDACYLSLGAHALTPEERPMLARVFAQWARYRLPARASAYQPDILLAATVGMATVVRIKPIAEKTAPWWRRLFDKIRPKPKLRVS